MVCTSLTTIKTFSDLLVWPTECNYYFYLLILGAIFIILSWTLFAEEKRRKGEGDMISALGVSSIAISSLGTIGTLIKNSSDIPMIQSDILLYIVAVTVVLVSIWIFKD